MHRPIAVNLVVAVALVGVVLPAPALAQTITTNLVTSPTPPQLGGELEVEVVLDLSSTSEALGSYLAALEWDTGVVELVEVTEPDRPGFDIPVQISDEGPYPTYPYSMTLARLKFANFSTQGIAGAASLLKAKFRVVGRSTQTPNLSVTFWEVHAAGTFMDLLPLVEGYTTHSGTRAEKDFEITPVGNETAVVKLDPKMDYWGVGPLEHRHLLLSATGMKNVQKIRVTVEAPLNESSATYFENPSTHTPAEGWPFPESSMFANLKLVGLTGGPTSEGKQEITWELEVDLTSGITVEDSLISGPGSLGSFGLTTSSQFDAPSLATVRLKRVEMEHAFPVRPDDRVAEAQIAASPYPVITIAGSAFPNVGTVTEVTPASGPLGAVLVRPGEEVQVLSVGVRTTTGLVDTYPSAPPIDSPLDQRRHLLALGSVHAYRRVAERPIRPGAVSEHGSLPR